MECWDHTLQPYPGEGAPPHKPTQEREDKIRGGYAALGAQGKEESAVVWKAWGPCKRQALHLHWKQWTAGTQSTSQGVAKSWRILGLHLEMIPRHPVQ